MIPTLPLELMRSFSLPVPPILNLIESPPAFTNNLFAASVLNAVKLVAASNCIPQSLPLPPIFKYGSAEAS